MEFERRALDLFAVTSRAQRGEFVHFDDFHVSAEGGAVLGQIGIDVEHSAVIMAHDAEAVVEHDVAPRAAASSHAIDFVPENRVIVEHAGDLMKGNAGAFEDVGNFRNGTGLTMRQPFAGHGPCGRPFC